MSRPPFDLLRACFYLLAVILLAELAFTMLSGFLCYYLNLVTTRTIGACLPAVELIRQQWSEILATILALLLAAKGPPPGPPAPPGAPDA